MDPHMLGTTIQNLVTWMIWWHGTQASFTLYINTKQR